MLERNIEGFNLIETSDNQWTIQTINGRAFSGTFLEVVMYCIIRLGFNVNEIDAAVKTMVRENHNAAHFGMWCGFIFSFIKVDDKDLYRRAS